jgi:peptide/nickel transport system substrate-binding protein
VKRENAETNGGAGKANCAPQKRPRVGLRIAEKHRSKSHIIKPQLPKRLDRQRFPGGEEMNFRSFVLTLAIAVGASLLSSCTLSPERSAQDSSSDLRQETSQTTPAASDLTGAVKVDAFNDRATGNEVPKKGGSVVLQFLSEPDSLNSFTDNSAVTQYISEYVFSSLLRRNWETFEYEPSLAERWLKEDVVIRSDGTKLRGAVSFSGPGETGDVTLRTADGASQRISRANIQEVRRGASFTFYLHKNARFHDGHPVTADDVKFTYDTIRNETVDAPSLRTYYVDMESCEVLDAHTVRITYGKQYWMAVDYAGGRDFTIFPRHIYDPDNLIEKDPAAFGKQFNESAYNRKPVGSGPYKFERWDTGNQLVLTRNPDYWSEKRAGYLDRIVFKFMSDPIAALQALKNGEVQFVTRIRAEQFENETNDPAFRERFARVEIYSPSLSYVGWNMRRPPFDDVKVRQAMAYGAIDREQYLREILYGHGVLVSAYQYYFGPAYDHTLGAYPFDQEKAEQLLLEAGWYDRDGDGLRDKNGQPFRFEFLQPSGGTSRIAPFMKENLRKLGIDMTVRELEWATFLENIYDRRFDACGLAWGLDIEGDPYQLWHTSQKENRGSNHVGFGNAETDAMIEESRRAIDAGPRRQIFYKFDRILFEEQPYLFMYMAPDLAAYDKRYRGVKLYKLRPGYDLTEWYLPEGV